jgi:hypothetical protein
MFDVRWHKQSRLLRTYALRCNACAERYKRLDIAYDGNLPQEGVIRRRLS